MAVGRAIPVLQIVGYQNSGKTTLVEKLVQALTKEDMQIGTIKHHGHGGKPDLPLQKDSERHRQAGAAVSSVEGGGLLSLSVNGIWPLQNIIELYTYFAVDAIIVEGYKKESYPKVVIIRSKEDLSLLERVENIIAVITWTELPKLESYKVFHITEDEKYMDWLTKRVRELK